MYKGNWVKLNKELKAEPKMCHFSPSQKRLFRTVQHRREGRDSGGCRAGNQMRWQLARLGGNDRGWARWGTRVQPPKKESHSEGVMVMTPWGWLREMQLLERWRTKCSQGDIEPGWIQSPEQPRQTCRLARPRWTQGLGGLGWSWCSREPRWSRREGAR